MKSFGASLKSALITNYFSFKGRAPRAEYWFFYLFYILASIAVSFIDIIIDPSLIEETHPLKASGTLGITLTLVMFIPSITVTARRLHDVGRSGWWMLIPLTIVGIIPYLYWVLKRGDREENRFGEDPYESAKTS